MLGEVVVGCVELGPDVLQLGVERFDHRRQEPVETESVAVVDGERGALVEVSVREQRAAGRGHGASLSSSGAPAAWMVAASWRRARTMRTVSDGAGAS